MNKILDKFKKKQKDTGNDVTFIDSKGNKKVYDNLSDEEINEIFDILEKLFLAGRISKKPKVSKLKKAYQKTIKFIKSKYIFYRCKIYFKSSLHYLDKLYKKYKRQKDKKTNEYDIIIAKIIENRHWIALQWKYWVLRSIVKKKKNDPEFRKKYIEIATTYIKTKLLKKEEIDILAKNK